MARKPAMTVVAAVKRDLAGMPKTLAESGIAATALVLAAQLDDGDTSATSKSMCAKELRELLERLRALSPPRIEVDRIDDVTRKREERRSRRASA
jgi:SpoVK/Ycf46/Vps4 family AAA+-type ATPase